MPIFLHFQNVKNSSFTDEKQGRKRQWKTGVCMSSAHTSDSLQKKKGIKLLKLHLDKNSDL